LISNFFKYYISSFKNINSKVWVLALTMLMNRSGSMVLMFMSLYITKDLHYTMSDASIVLSGYGIGSICGSYLGGWLTEKYHYKDIMMSSLILSGFLLFGLQFTKDLYAMTAIVFFYSLIADTFRPPNSIAVTKYANPKDLTRSFSLMRLAINLGFTIGPAMGGIVAAWVGYKYLFMIDSCTSFFAAMILWRTIPRIEDTKAQKSKELAKSDTRSAYKDRPFLAFIFLVTVFATMFFQLFTSITVYLSKVGHYSEDYIGYILAINGFLIVLLEMPIVMKYENYKHKNYLLALGCFLLGLSYAILYLGNAAVAITIIYTIMITLAEIATMPFMMSITMQRAPKNRQGQYSALYSIAYGIAIILAPVIGLNIAEYYSFDTMFFVVISLSVLAGIGFYYLKLDSKSDIN
jgi:predicted MFS family arabinose efflux permease